MSNADAVDPALRPLLEFCKVYRDESGLGLRRNPQGQPRRGEGQHPVPYHWSKRAALARQTAPPSSPPAISNRPTHEYKRRPFGAVCLITSAPSQGKRRTSTMLLDSRTPIGQGARRRCVVCNFPLLVQATGRTRISARLDAETQPPPRQIPDFRRGPLPTPRFATKPRFSINEINPLWRRFGRPRVCV